MKASMDHMNIYKPRLILLVGIPGSGKSTFAEKLMAIDPSKCIRINQDELKSRRACESATRAALRKSLCPIIDRCNFNSDQRRYFIDIAKEFEVEVDCIVFKFSQSICLDRCLGRKGHPTVDHNNAAIVVHQIAKQLENPDTGTFNLEGITRLKLIANENDLKITLGYYFSLVK